MKKLVLSAVVLAATTSMAFAGSNAQKPTKLSDAQLDAVVAAGSGSLVSVGDVASRNLNGNTVSVPVLNGTAVSAGVGVGVLGTGAGANAQVGN